MLVLGPPPLVVSAQLRMVTCNGACDGSIVVTPAGGNGFYGFTWSPVPPNGQGSNGAFNLCPGDWTVTVADVNGCDTTITYLITEPPVLTLGPTSTPSTCSVCSGTAAVQPSGGTLPYAYSWTRDGSVFATDSALTGLCAALYGITVTDANGCSAQAPVPVNDADGEVVTTTGDVVTCPGVCDGDVSASFNCAVPACTVAWFDAGGTDLHQSGTALQDLCAGTYFVRVTNGDGCVTQEPAVVSEPDPIVANLSTTPVTCSGACDGTATVGPTGGAGGYAFDWEPDPPNGDGGPQATDLCAGTYQVTITDAAGCSIVQGVIILGPTPITAVAVVGPITCNGACDGSITVNAQGGNGGFTYAWSPGPITGQGTSTVSQLCAGDRTLTITDLKGCDTTFTVPVAEPPVLLTDLTTADNACFGDCSGTGHIDVSGGIAPYAIAWVNAAGDTLARNTADVGNLCSGDYSVTVADANRCVRTLPFIIAPGVAIEANLLFTNETCQGPCDGTASIAPTGGSGMYTITWSPEPATGQGTPTVTGLCAGNNRVTIADAAGCDTTITFTVLPFQPIVPNAVVQNVTCNGACNGSVTLAPAGGNGPYTYVWSPEPATGQGTGTVSGLCAGDITVTITDATRCDTTVTFTITEPPALAVTVDDAIDASCNTAADGSIAISISGGVPGYGVSWSGPGGFSSTDEDITGLLPGVYDVTVTDANSCTTTLQVTVGALNSVVADAGPAFNDCAGMPITLDGSNSQGATAYQWTDGDNNVVGTGAVVQVGGLPPGIHTFTLTVSDGPCSATDDVQVTIFPSPVADAGPDQSVFVQGTVTLGGQPSGPLGSTFAWAPDSLLDHADAANPAATVHRTTWFVLTVVGPDGCVDTDSVLVTVIPEVKVPSGFSPNGDGYNDTWQLDFIDLFPDCEVEIFNRWGEPLFKSVGYRTPWDGRYKNGFVPVGTYYYAINLNDPRFPEALTGPLTVIR
ncbi:MAG: gliding motility-associated C-terminal domain-containing protein [Flavobacteriales bacterium]